MIDFKMNNGLSIPALGFGTFMMSSADVRSSLPQAIDAGMRHIDTANAYFNEVAVGEIINSSGIDRGEFFVTTKLFPQDYPEDRCMKAIDASLRRLGMDYVDLLLLHQPYGAYVEAWKVLEQAVQAGKVRSIGLSNFNRRKTQQVLDVADILPQIMQIEINPRNNQHEMKGWLADKGVVFEGWYPLGHGDRKLIENDIFSRLAAKYGKTNAQVILRWHIQEGNVIFPMTTNPDHMKENIDIFDFSLTDAEMAEIDSIPQKPYYLVSEDAPAFVLTESDFDRQH